MTSIKIDNITFPTQSIQATLQVQGIYAIPEDWKSTDQANPGLFTYIVRMSKFQITKGKVTPRQLTEREKRELEEKNKKGGKKDSKNPEPNQEEEKLKKAEQERQRKRQQLFAKLTEQEQFYHTAQDIYRSPFIKFEQKLSSATLKANDCLVFQERLLKDKGDWVYIYKVPTVSEDQLAKMKKTKPKTINNINDLNPVVMRTWVNLQDLSASKQSKQVSQIRCKISQVDKTAQSSQPNLQRTYVKLAFSLSQPVIKQKDSYTTASLINDPQKPKEVSPQVKSLNELKQQLSLAIQSLAMEYSAMFWKQINMQQEQRNTLVFLNNKKGEATKRKQQFLYDFNITGKYKILKDRIKKTIVHLCKTKYQKQFEGLKSFNGVKCNSMDQLYSEIYNLLITTYQETIFQIMNQKQQSLEEVLVSNNQTLKQQNQRVLNSYKEQTVIERVKRAIRQYQTVLNFGYGEGIFKKYIQQSPQNAELKYQYGIYCLKYNLKSTKQVLPQIEEYLTRQKFTLTDDKKIQYMVILFNIGGESYQKGWVILREIIQIQQRTNVDANSPHLSRWVMLASVVLKNMQKEELSQKYKFLAVRQYKKFLLRSQSHQSQNSKTLSHKDAPNKSQIPSISGAAQYQVQTVELGRIYDELISYLVQFSAFQLIGKVTSSKADLGGEVHSNQLTFEKALPQMNQALVKTSQQSTQKLLSISLKLYQSSTKNEQKNKVLQYVVKAYFLKIYQSSNNKATDLVTLEKYLKKSLMGNNDSFSRFITLLRLGYVYVQKQQFGNARACFLKYLQKSSQFPEYLSGLSYKLLGLSSLRLNKTDEAVQNFKHWNLSDSKSTSPWLYLAWAFTKQKNLILVNQCLSQYKQRVRLQNETEQETQILKQIKQRLEAQDEEGQYLNVLKIKIIQTLA